MKSIWPWLFYIALGVAAALLLDADASIPFFIIWALAGLCMAIEADNALMEKTKQECTKTEGRSHSKHPERRRLSTDPRAAGMARHYPNRQKPLDFLRY
jgi:hypothetical protein